MRSGGRGRRVAARWWSDLAWKSFEKLKEGGTGTRSEQADREPGNEGDDEHADQQHAEVGPDPAHGSIRMDPADRARGVVAEAERRREQADAHGEDDHHRVVHLVDAD